MSEKRKYDSTVARIAGNVVNGLLERSHYALREADQRLMLAEMAVDIAEAIVAEVERRAALKATE